MIRRCHQLAVLAAIAAFACAAGCEQEQRIVGARTMLDGLEGAVHGDGSAADNAAVPKGSSLETITDDKLTVISPIGEVRIVSQSPRHVLLHLRRLLTEGYSGVKGAEGKEQEVFTEQLLSTTTKKRLLQEGQDVDAAWEYLTANRDDVITFVAAMPNGELSTEVLMEQAGEDLWRLAFRDGLRRRSLRYQQIWICREGRTFKFLWIN